MDTANSDSTQVKEVFNTLKVILLKILDIDEEQITFGTSISALGLESLDYVEIQVELSKKYGDGVKLEEQVFTSGKVETLEQFAQYVAQLRVNAS